MRARGVSIVLCAALAASAALWAAWPRLRPAPPASRAAGIDGGSANTAAPPGTGSPGSGPTAVDEGEIVSPAAGDNRDRSRRAPRAPAPRPTAPHDATSRPVSPPRLPAASGTSAPRPAPAATPPAQGTTAPADSHAVQTGGPAHAATGGDTAAGSGSDAGPGGGAASTPPAAPARTPVVIPPRVIATEGTAYPGDAFRLTVRRADLGAAAVIEGSEGTVAIRALVLSTGEVRDVTVTASSGSDALDRAAVDAVRGWRFAPATRDGAPIDAYVTLRIRYVVR